MKKQIGSGAGPALLELIIVIGLFAVFTALDLRIFAAARRVSDEGQRLTCAVEAAENAAELFKAGLEPTLYYDGDWLPSDKENAEYTVTVVTFSQNGEETARISVADKKGALFSLTAKSPEAPS